MVCCCKVEPKLLNEFNHMNLKKMEPELLQQFYLECDPDESTPTLYFSNNKFIRWFFWLRLEIITKFMQETVKNFDTCLDFGGGGGEFLPTLSKYFNRVVLLDLNTERASKVVEHFDLKNVTLDQKNIFHDDGSTDHYSVIIAADVLEHFKEPQTVIKILKGKLAEDGFLLTSLPTEGYTYVILRAILGIKKPIDHYFSSYEVETMLRDAGLKKINRIYLPLKFDLFALFSITVWTH